MIYTSSGPATKAFRDAVLNLARSIPEPLVRRGYPRVPAAAFATELAGVPEAPSLRWSGHARDAFASSGAPPTEVSSSARSRTHRDTQDPRRPASGLRSPPTLPPATASAQRPRLDAAFSMSVAPSTPRGMRCCPSRAALGEGARSMDRARGKMRRTEPEEALALWRSLIAGQWTLVEQLDTDGRCYLFARRNAPGRPGSGATSRPYDKSSPRRRRARPQDDRLRARHRDFDGGVPPPRTLGSQGKAHASSSCALTNVVPPRPTRDRPPRPRSSLTPPVATAHGHFFESRATRGARPARASSCWAPGTRTNDYCDGSCWSLASVTHGLEWRTPNTRAEHAPIPARPPNARSP